MSSGTTPFLRRIGDLRAVAVERLSGDPEAEVYGVACDGCGAFVVRFDSDALLAALDGWRLGEESPPDYCPRCRCR